MYATDRQKSSGNVENTQLRFGSPRRDPFFDPSPPLFVFRPIFVNQWASVFQPGFHEWLPGAPRKGTEIAWDEISNHSSMRL